MSRVILLLPSPDVLQLANCHKYVTRGGGKQYADIYTLTTIANTCAAVDKILVIGHGEPGGFETASVDEVAAAIIASGISLTGNKKIAFDTCYAASREDDNGLEITSALHAIRVRLKKHDFDCNLTLVGATGPTVTIGRINDKRVVVNPANLAHAANLQGNKVNQHGVNLFAQKRGWHEGAPSGTIKRWAQEEYGNLIGFAVDFRAHLGPDLDESPGRKVSLQV